MELIINFHARKDKLLWCKVFCLVKVLLMLNAAVAVAEIPLMSSPTEGFLTVHNSQLIVAMQCQAVGPQKNAKPK